jgi:hypothetical protein
VWHGARSAQSVQWLGWTEELQDSEGTAPLQRVESLLSNGYEISNYTTAVTRLRLRRTRTQQLYSSRRKVFSVRSVPRCYKQDKLVRCKSLSRVEWNWVSELVSEYVSGVLRYGRCEMLLTEAGHWGRLELGNQEERGMFAVGNHYQRTGEDTAGSEDLSVCCSELQSVWISISAVVTCN